MNRKQFIVLLVLVLVVGGIGLALYNKNNAEYQGGTRAGQKLLGEFNVNDVSHVAIKQGPNEVNLVKTGDIWTVKERNNYPANFEQISEFVRKAQDLKVVQTVKVGPSQRSKLELAEPGKPFAATVVEFKGEAGKEVKTFWLGAKHVRKSQQQASPFGEDAGGTPDGRYVLTSPTAETVAVVSDPLTAAEAKPENWLNKDFLKVEKIKSIQLQATEATNSWKAARETETGSWTVADAKSEENFDTNKLSGFSHALNNPSFIDVAIDKPADQTGLDKPAVVTIQTFDGFTYRFSVGKQSPDQNQYVQVAVSAEFPKERTPAADEKAEDKEKLEKEFKEKQQKLQEKLKEEQAFAKWTYTVPKWSLEQVLKNRSELLVSKEEKKTAENDGAGEAPGTLDGPGLGADLP